MPVDIAIMAPSGNSLADYLAPVVAPASRLRGAPTAKAAVRNAGKYQLWHTLDEKESKEIEALIRKVDADFGQPRYRAGT